MATYLVITAGPATAKEFATLHLLEGRVEVKGVEAPAFIPGADGDNLREGDTVRTAPTGRAEIEFFDGSITRLDGGTELVLKALSSDPDVPDSKTIVTDQKSGKTLNRVVELTDSQSRFETETPNAVASVRGTDYVVIFHPNGDVEYWCLSGNVIILLPDGTEVDLGPGQGVVVDTSGNPGEVFDVEDTDLEELCALDDVYCEDEVLGEEITAEEEEVATTVEEETSEDESVELIPPLVIIRDDSPPEDDEDTTPPTTTITDGPSQDEDADSRNADFTVESNEPSTFECKVDDLAYDECLEPSDGGGELRTTLAVGDELITELLTQTIGLPDGEHTFQARATDASDNTGDPDSWTWTISAAPNAEILGDPFVEGDDVTIAVSSDEDPVDFDCKLTPDDEGFGECPEKPAEVVLDRVSPLDASPPFYIFYEDLANGDYTLQVVATDEDGNTDPDPAETGFTIDVPEPPSPPDTILDPTGPTGITTSDSATFTFSSDPAGATFECSLDGNPFAVCTSPKTYSSLGDGIHTFQVQATNAGGADPTPATRSWRVGTGEAISITLAWATGARDLDLHVVTPRGEINYSTTRLCEGNNCWGSLDDDANSADPTPPGDEIISIIPIPPTDEANGGFVAGNYSVYVHNYDCAVPFDETAATVTIFDGSTTHPFSLPVQANPSDDQWNVATFSLTPLGLSGPPVGTQTYQNSDWDSEGCDGGEFDIAGRQGASESFGTSSVAHPSPSETTARVNDDGNVRVEWLPEDMEATVRMVADDPDEEFPDEITDGDLGCEGTGHCVIEGPAPGATLYLTVFPAGVDALDPVEDVTSVRIEVPGSTSSDDPPAGSGDEGSTGEVQEENPPATEGDTPPDGLPPEDPPEPEGEPDTPNPPPED